MYSGLSQAGGLGSGGALAPQFLAKQLTLSQPGGQIMPTTVLQASPDFQTLRRPCQYHSYCFLTGMKIRIIKSDLNNFFLGKQQLGAILEIDVLKKLIMSKCVHNFIFVPIQDLIFFFFIF
jgi:hypothetical protein